jgi:hypothetical protein
VQKPAREHSKSFLRLTSAPPTTCELRISVNDSATCLDARYYSVVVLQFPAFSQRLQALAREYAEDVLLEIEND